MDANDGDGFDFDAVADEIVTFGKSLFADVAAGEMELDEAFLMMAHVAGIIGYRQGQQHLVARFIPVLFTEAKNGVAQLSPNEAITFLREHRPAPGARQRDRSIAPPRMRWPSSASPAVAS